MCISHPFAFEVSPSLSPFATWPALPAANYYGDSVTMGLAPVRPSRVPLVLNVSSMILVLPTALVATPV